MKNLDGKRAFITGGSSGIGLETARLLASRGVHVAIFARNREKLEAARDVISAARKNENQQVEISVMDVTDPKGVEQGMAQAARLHGAPDILIANAGQGHGDYFENIAYETFDRIIKTNVYGVRNVTAAALPFMKGRGGNMVIVASLAGLTPIPGYTAYGTSKFALVGFAECLRPELKPHGIVVTVVCPPEVTTPLVEDEARTMPGDAKFLKYMAGVLTVDVVAKDLVCAIEQDRFLVIPGARAKMSYGLKKFLPGALVRGFMDQVVRAKGSQHL